MDDKSDGPLTRRVPGANFDGRAIPDLRQSGLPDELLLVAQAAVEAERACPDQPDPPVQSRKQRRAKKPVVAPRQSGLGGGITGNAGGSIALDQCCTNVQLYEREFRPS